MGGPGGAGASPTSKNVENPENPIVGKPAMAYPPPDTITKCDPSQLIHCTIIDVKRLANNDGNCASRVEHNDEANVAFVRWKDRERRFAEWVHRSRLDPASLPDQPTDAAGHVLLGPPTTSLSCYDAIPAELRTTYKNTMDFLEERLRLDMTSPNSVRRLHYAGMEMTPWHYSPFAVLHPQFTHRSGLLRDAFVCPFTLTPFESPNRLQRHLASYVRSGAPLSVPGKEVYRDDAAGLSLMEVDGRVHQGFCRNVFLLAKCFLECKLVGHDTDLYVLYVVAVHAERHCAEYMPAVFQQPSGASPESNSPRYFAGYYTYERGSVDCNLACIVTLPCFQGRGLGRFLIEASYEVGYRKGITGSPERPLSELGRAAYDRFWAEKVWRWALDNALSAVEQKRPVQPGAYDAAPGGGAGSRGALATMRVTIHEMAKALRLDSNDVLETVLRLGLVHRTEARTLKLLIPVELAKREVERVAQSPAPFDPRRLRGVSTSID
jgi:GNAT superfamily N-acetyltransferase